MGRPYPPPPFDDARSLAAGPQSDLLIGERLGTS